MNHNFRFCVFLYTFEQNWVGNLPPRAIPVNFHFENNFFSVFEQTWLGNLPPSAILVKAPPGFEDSVFVINLPRWSAKNSFPRLWQRARESTRGRYWVPRQTGVYPAALQGSCARIQRSNSLQASLSSSATRRGVGRQRHRRRARSQYLGELINR